MDNNDPTVQQRQITIPHVGSYDCSRFALTFALNFGNVSETLLNGQAKI